MLVLSRKKEEAIRIGDNITIRIIEIRGDKVRLGIEAPTEVPVHRQEVYDAIQEENAAAGTVPGRVADLVGKSVGSAPLAALISKRS